MSELNKLLKKTDLRKLKSGADPALLLERGIETIIQDLTDSGEKTDPEAAGKLIRELMEKPILDLDEKGLLNLCHVMMPLEKGGYPGQIYRMGLTEETTGRKGTAPADIPRLMGHLGDQLRSSHGSLHPLELGAMIHKRVMDILPFSQKNEVFARLMMNLVLLKNGYGTVAISSETSEDYQKAAAACRSVIEIDVFEEWLAKSIERAPLE